MIVYNGDFNRLESSYKICINPFAQIFGGRSVKWLHLKRLYSRLQIFKQIVSKSQYISWQISYRQDIIPLTHYFPVNLFEECCGWQ